MYEVEPTVGGKPFFYVVVVYFNIEMWKTFQIIFLFTVNIPQNITYIIHFVHPREDPEIDIKAEVVFNINTAFT